MSGQAVDPSFVEVERLIANARARAYQSVNSTLIDLYWRVGEYISGKIASAEWGDSVVPRLAAHIARSQPGLRGFTRANLFRMRQFYETYQGDEIVAPLVRQLPWAHHLTILGQSKRPEEREFYIRRRHRQDRRARPRRCGGSMNVDTIIARIPSQTADGRPEAVSAFAILGIGGKQ